MSDDLEKPKSCSASRLGFIVIVIGAVVGGAVGGEIGKQALHAVGRLFTSHSAILTETVSNIKSAMPLPHPVDEVTTLTDVQADVKELAIVYSMTVKGAKLTNEEEARKSLKANVLKMCAPANSDALFKEGIHFAWNYHFVDDNKDIVITLKPEDCNH